MRHEEIKDLLGAFALGAVSGEERSEVDRHLRRCDECRAEIADYDAVANSLAMAVEPALLPLGFTERVVSAAAGERTVEEVERLRRRWTRLGVAAGVAILAAVIAIPVTLLVSDNDVDRRREVLALLSSNEGIALTGGDEVIARVAGDEFAIAGLEEAPEGKIYKLWLMRGDTCPSADPAECELVSAGSFDTEEGVALLDLDESAESWEDAAVTVEDDEDVDFPTTDPFVHSL